MAGRWKALSRAHFGSALLGGLVVAVLGWVALAAGFVEAPADDQTGSVTPLASTPVNAKAGGGSTVAEIYRADSAGVAHIEAERPAQPSSPFDFFGGAPGGGTASGSGFVIDGGGHLLTNHHVVAGAQTIRVQLGRSERSYEAERVGTDPATDLALLRVDAPASQLHPLSLGDSSGVRVGDPVVAIGNPFGLDQTATTGIVSARQRQIEAPNGFAISDVIQTDASINPGNSGGPLINSAGQVIGITSQIETGGGGGSVGIGFAIPSNTARQVVAQLKEDGEVKHAFLGISGVTVTPEVAKALNLPVQVGVLVQEVVEGGPAEEGGIRGGDTAATLEGANLRLGGDIITAIDGGGIDSMEEVVTVVNSARPGDELEVTVRRGDEEQSFTLMLGER